MTLLEVTEPLFQYVCRLNRLARRSASASASTGKSDTMMFTKGGAGGASAASAPMLDYGVVRSEIKALFEDLQQKPGRDSRLAAQVKQMELPLIFFVDSMISESNLSFAAKWNQNRLAFERHELAGDEKFFDLLEETLKDSSEEASERLAVFYTCLGLGFTGLYFSQPEYLRKTMLTIAPRIRRLMDGDQSSKICPEAYTADERNLVQPPGTRLVFVGILFLCFTLAVLFAYAWMYHSAKVDLENAFKEIKTHDLNPPVK
jgi:type VI protein secretion system component VasF